MFLHVDPGWPNGTSVQPTSDIGKASHIECNFRLQKLYQLMRLVVFSYKYKGGHLTIFRFLMSRHFRVIMISTPKLFLFVVKDVFEYRMNYHSTAVGQSEIEAYNRVQSADHNYTDHSLRKKFRDL